MRTFSPLSVIACVLVYKQLCVVYEVHKSMSGNRSMSSHRSMPFIASHAIFLNRLYCLYLLSLGFHLAFPWILIINLRSSSLHRSSCLHRMYFTCHLPGYFSLYLITYSHLCEQWSLTVLKWKPSGGPFVS